MELIDEIKFQLSAIDLTPQDRAKIRAYLLSWFETTPKAPTVTANQLTSFKAKLSALAATLQIRLVVDNVIVEAPVDSAATLTLVRLGSMWFAGNANINVELLAATQS